MSKCFIFTMTARISKKKNVFSQPKLRKKNGRTRNLMSTKSPFEHDDPDGNQKSSKKL